MVRKKRVRPVNRDYEIVTGSRLNPSVYDKHIVRVPKRIRALVRYGMYGPRKHVDQLNLGSEFINSLNKNTRILEVGAGSGRLADYILRKHKIAPENYEILDLAYDPEEMPYMRGRIHRLIKKGKIKVTKADLLEHDYPKESYDHILLPDSFVAAWEHVSHVYPVSVAAAISLKKLLAKLQPALRRGGSIRISSVDENYFRVMGERYPKKMKKLMGDFDVEHTKNGLILKKKTKTSTR